MEPGPIVDEAGIELGEHQGALAYTPGQRRGLGVSRGTEALHVLRIDAPTNTIVVGTLSRLGRRSVDLRDVQVRTTIDRIDACFRMRAATVPGVLQTAGAGKAQLQLDRDAFQVAPGQVAVLYDGDCIVAAGTVAG